MTDLKTKTKRKRTGSQTPVYLKSDIDKNTKYRISDEAIDSFSRKSGIQLMPWQKTLVKGMLAVKPEQAGWLHPTFGFLVPRQNGKTFIAIFRMLIGAILLKERFIFSAHNNDLVSEVFEDISKLVENNAFLRKHIPLDNFYNNGKRGMGLSTVADKKTKNTGYIHFVTRGFGNSNPGRGKTADIVFYDEMHLVSSNHVKSLDAVTATRPWSQSIYLGTPPDPKEEKADQWFLDFRKNLRGTTNGGVYWAEWGLTRIPSKEHRSYWYKTNPSLNLRRADGAGLSEENMKASATRLDDHDFAVERLGYMPEDGKSTLIDYDTWVDLRDISWKLEDIKTEKRVLSLKINPAGTVASLVIASSDVDRETFVDTILVSTDSQDWVSKIPDFIAKLARNPKCVAVLLDGYPHIDSVKQALATRGLWNLNNSSKKQGKIEEINTQTIAMSVYSFVAGIKDRNIVHRSLDSKPLSMAVKQAKERKLRGSTQGYGFAAMDEITDMTVLEAAALAYYRANSAAVNTYGRIARRDAGENRKQSSVSNGNNMLARTGKRIL